ncbi:MAG: RelA/SpoT domain protein [Oscillospiraceae bacterium]|nr:RelA/SpoT domain protein [Oscillospiraceae bacterium]
MTREEYYADSYPRLREAQKTLETIAEEMKTAVDPHEDLQPIVYYCSRIKNPESMQRKLAARGLPVTLESALCRVYDAVGIRIICSFASDVLSVVEKLKAHPAIEILEEKDYLLHPKPNGYRSIHLCIRLREPDLRAEIQVRTIAMDFWATLEHQLKYKKSIPCEGLIRSELKRCADEIASADLSMQTIREIIKQM